MIASSHLLRRRDRAAVLLQEAEPWDLVVLDEAHHARRRAAGSAREGGANALLRLMRGLKERTDGLVLLTATPMQMHPVEVWDLLNLLGLPPEWTDDAFLRFFDDLAEPSPPPERRWTAWRGCSRRSNAPMEPPVPEAAARLTGLTRLKTNKVLRALRDEAGNPAAPVGDPRAARGPGDPAHAHADPASDLAPYTRAAAPLPRGRDALHPDRPTPGR